MRKHVSTCTASGLHFNAFLPAYRASRLVVCRNRSGNATKLFGFVAQSLTASYFHSGVPKLGGAIRSGLFPETTAVTLIGQHCCLESNVTVTGKTQGNLGSWGALRRQEGYGLGDALKYWVTPLPPQVGLTQKQCPDTFDDKITLINFSVIVITSYSAQASAACVATFRALQ